MIPDIGRRRGRVRRISEIVCFQWVIRTAVRSQINGGSGVVFLIGIGRIQFHEQLMLRLDRRVVGLPFLCCFLP